MSTKKASAQRKPVSSEGLGSDSLSAFAAEIGSSKGTDPIPPDQYLTYRHKRYTPELRLWAALLEHTIRLGKGRWSTFAVDVKGKAIKLNDVAAQLKMDPGNARRAWRNMEDEGRVRRGKDGRLYLSGDFVLAPEKPMLLPTYDDDETEGEDEAKKKVCTDLIRDFFAPPYAMQILKLPAKSAKRILELEVKRRDRQKRVAADLMAASRDIADREQLSMFQSFGVKVIKTEREIPPEKAAEIEARRARVQSLVPVVSAYVQTYFEDAPGGDKKVCTNTKNGSVQTFAPYMYSEEVQRGITLVSKSVESKRVGVLARTPITSDSLHDLQKHFEAIAEAQRPQLGTPNLQTCKNFWAHASHAADRISVEELSEVVFDLIRDGGNAGLTSWGGVFELFRETCKAVS